MTWYANQVFAEPSRAAVAAFSRVPGAGAHLYHVDDVGDREWPDPSVPHGLPAGGLLVGRELCDEAADAYEWHGEDAISWTRFSAPEDPAASAERVVVPEVVRAESGVLSEIDLPPASFLAFLQDLSRKSGTTVSYYAASAFGGELEYAYAWTFGGRNRTYLRVEPGLVCEYAPDTPPRIVPGDVLVLTLRHHGLLLPSPYFALHARDFDWDEHRLRGPRPM